MVEGTSRNPPIVLTWYEMKESHQVESTKTQNDLEVKKEVFVKVTLKLKS